MVSDNLRKARISRGLKQLEVAEKIGCAATSITNWENGNVKPPLEKLEAICLVYGVHPLDILDRAYGIEEVASIAQKPVLDRSYEETVALAFSGDLILNHLKELSASGNRKAETKMRDANRIPIVLEEVKKVWEENADWRLGQLIVNISRAAGKMDPFFLEDEELLKILKGAENAVET